MELEPLQDEADIEQLAVRVYEDPANRAATGWHDPADKEEAIEALVGLWHRRFGDGWRIFAVVEDKRAAGLAGWGPAGRGEAPPWLGIYLLDEARGRGLGTKATQALVEDARRQGTARLHAVTRAKNTASQRLLERVGFRELGLHTAGWALESDEEWIEYELEL